MPCLLHVRPTACVPLCGLWMFRAGGRLAVKGFTTKASWGLSGHAGQQEPSTSACRMPGVYTGVIALGLGQACKERSSGAPLPPTDQYEGQIGCETVKPDAIMTLLPLESAEDVCNVVIADSSELDTSLYDHPLASMA